MSCIHSALDTEGNRHGLTTEPINNLANQKQAASRTENKTNKQQQQRRRQQTTTKTYRPTIRYTATSETNQAASKIIITE